MSLSIPKSNVPAQTTYASSVLLKNLVDILSDSDGAHKLPSSKQVVFMSYSKTIWHLELRSPWCLDE